MQKGPKFGRMKNKEIRLYFQNKNLQSTLVGSKSVFEPDLDPKNSPNGPKKLPRMAQKVKKAQNMAEPKTKR